MPTLDVLLIRWRANDEKAAEAIYNLHRDRVYRLAYGLLGNTEDAEEAAQDAMTYALLNIHNYDSSRSKFTTWLHTITVSRSRDMLRKRRLPTFSISAWLKGKRDYASPELNPEQQAIQSEKHNSVWQAVQELNPPLREAITLRHWGGHTYREIADIVGCPMRTVQSRVRLAYQRLEKELAEADQRHLAKENIR